MQLSIYELKYRGLSLLLSYILLFYFLYLYKEELLYKITFIPTTPYFIFTNITEAFFNYLKLINLGCFLFLFPFIFLHIWLFLIPGLYKKEKYFLLKTFLIILLIIYLSNYYLIPNMYKFFIGYNSDYLTLEPKINEYINLTTNIIIQIIIISSISVILYYGINIKTEYLIRNRKYMIIASLIISSLITPPEIINQILMSIPIIISYEFKIYKQLNLELQK